MYRIVAVAQDMGIVDWDFAMGYPCRQPDKNLLRSLQRKKDQPIKRQHRGERVMTIDRYVMAFAGGFIILSVLLAVFHSLYWLLFTVFVGFNLLQSAFTGFCPLAVVLRKLEIKNGVAFSQSTRSLEGLLERNRNHLSASTRGNADVIDRSA